MKEVNTKERVRDFGEVYTNEKEINAMLDFTEDYLKIPSSKYLEPSAGSGNFVVAIFKRKLAYHNPETGEEFENLALTILSNIYSVDILKDNVEATKARLRELIPNKSFHVLAAVEKILAANIIHGNMLTKQDLSNEGPIRFTDWELAGAKLRSVNTVTVDEIIEGSHEQSVNNQRSGV